MDFFSDPVLDRILRSLPTKVAVQTCLRSKQWKYVASSLRTLDLDELDDFQRHDDDDDREHLHSKFIEFLEGFLPFFIKNNKRGECLAKLRLRMRMFTVLDEYEETIITKWLEYACRSQKGLTELDVCLDHYIEPYNLSVTEHLAETQLPPGAIIYKDFDRLRLFDLFSRCGESLTSLKLEFVKLLQVWHFYGDPHPRPPFAPALFPSLKILSLKAVNFCAEESPRFLLRECPSIEHLSLTYCSFKSLYFYVSCPNIKYMEVKYCEVEDIRVDRALNLESFSFVSPRDWDCETMILNSAFSLKHIDVSVDNNIRVFSLLGCHRALEASIKCKGIYEFEFFDAYLSAKFSFISNNHSEDQPSVDYATILLVIEQIDDREGYIPRLASFIESFRCCKNVSLYSESFQSLVSLYVELFQASFSDARISNLPSQFEYTYDYAELLHTLRWMAPYVNQLTRTMEWIVEDERNKIHRRLQRARVASDRGDLAAVSIK